MSNTHADQTKAWYASIMNITHITIHYKPIGSEATVACNGPHRFCHPTPNPFRICTSETLKNSCLKLAILYSCQFLPDSASMSQSTSSISVLGRTRRQTGARSYKGIATIGTKGLATFQTRQGEVSVPEIIAQTARTGGISVGAPSRHEHIGPGPSIGPIIDTSLDPELTPKTPDIIDPFSTLIYIYRINMIIHIYI